MSIKVLITDPISDKGLKLLKDNSIEVVYETDLSSKDILKVSENVD